MTDARLDRHLRFLTLGTLFLGALIAAHTVSTLLLVKAQQSAASLVAAKTLPAAPDVHHAAPLSAFLERNLFAAARERPSGCSGPIGTDGHRSKATACAPHEGAERLVTTFVARDQASSVAVVALPEDPQGLSLARTGSLLADGGRVVAIGRRSVVIDRDGECSLISLDAPHRPKTKKRPSKMERDPRAVRSHLAKGITRSGPRQFRVPRSTVDHILSNLSMVAGEGRIVPSFDGGRPNGFKVLAVRPRGLFAAIGMKNGDVIQKINGLDVTSPETMYGAYSKLKRATSVQVDVVRRGQPASLRYSIE